LRDVRPEKVRGFDEVKSALAKQYVDSERERVYSEVSGKLTDAIYQDPTSLAAAAKDLGLEVQKAPLFARTGGAGIAANPGVVKAAFSGAVLTEAIRRSIELGPNHIVLIRVDQHEKSVPKTWTRCTSDSQEARRAATGAAGARPACCSNACRRRDAEQIAEPLKAKVTEKDIGRNAANLDQALVAEAFVAAAAGRRRRTAGSRWPAMPTRWCRSMPSKTPIRQARREITRSGATSLPRHGQRCRARLRRHSSQGAKIKIAEDRLQ
jgi:peptidyl-prolyl cis-trans isomerase D